MLLCAHEGQLAMAANTLALAPHWDRLPTTLWQEWLVPYSPHCLLWLLAGLDPRLRWCSFGFALVVCVYLWITNAVLAHFEPGRAEIHEQGAFFVTIAAPTVLFGVARLSMAGLRVAVLLGLPFAIAFTRLGDWQPEPPGFGAAVEDFDRNHRAWILCDEPATDYGWIRKRAGAVPVFCVWEIERELTLYHDAGIAIDGDGLGHWLDAQFTRIEHEGRCMLITERAREAMNHHSDSRLRTLIHDWVPAHFRLDAIQLGPFEAVQLHRR